MAFVVGLVGGSGSGKSTLVAKLFESDLGDSMALLPLDSYYLNPSDMPETVRTEQNWDHPSALDWPLYLDHVRRLNAGEPVPMPVYDFTTHTRKSESVVVEPKPIVILEGLFLFGDPQLREQLNLKIYIETPADLRLLRRIVRDSQSRGRSLDSVRQQYESTVRPMHNEHIEPTRNYADVIIPWENYNERAAELIAARLRECLRLSG